MRSQEDIKALEKGWSTKFKMAKALEENPTKALYRPVSRAGVTSAKKSNKSAFNESIEKKELNSEEELLNEPIPDLNMRDKLEFRKLTRRYGNQPSNFS